MAPNTTTLDPSPAFLKVFLRIFSDFQWLKMKLFWRMNTEEKLEACERKKIDGNALFRAGKVNDASKKVYNTLNMITISVMLRRNWQLLYGHHTRPKLLLVLINAPRIGFNEHNTRGRCSSSSRSATEKKLEKAATQSSFDSSVHRSRLQSREGLWQSNWRRRNHDLLQEFVSLADLVRRLNIQGDVSFGVHVR
ncbi:hypothetical protein M9H77_17349 [Catharanthus roseus]|uniref:Uncharacterized protein n=1 Tax=Catharanthus roseus TaxID=4058 RepID=A0ACC0B4C6_CATRO|nr:hypothetical protein M9H77_17349 [Catharanthus roseus]